MATVLVLPKLGLTMTEGTISRWHKKEGESVSKGDVLYSLETDKLTNDVESSESGVLLKIILGDGSTAPCMAPVAVIGVAGEDISALLAPAASEPVAAKSGSAADSAREAQVAAPAAEGGVGVRVAASPAARKLAKEKGVDLSALKGTGPNGLIGLKDVEEALENRGREAKTSPTAERMMIEGGISAEDIGVTDRRIMKADVAEFTKRTAGAQEAQTEEVRPMSQMRRVISKRMSESWKTSPAVTLDISVDMTELARIRAVFKEMNIKASYTDFLVYTAARTLTSFPLLNCSTDGSSIVYKNYVNIGVAVALPDGLLVPVVRDAHIKSLSEISKEIAALAGGAKGGTLSIDSLSGGTFTITNLGMFGIESFTPIINQPEVAILGVNAIQDVFVPVNGAPVVKPMLKLSLTTDHRVVDGAVAAQFLAELKKKLETPALLML